jgi:hypothetical protein
MKNRRRRLARVFQEVEGLHSSIQKGDGAKSSDGGVIGLVGEFDALDVRVVQFANLGPDAINRGVDNDGFGNASRLKKGKEMEREQGTRQEREKQRKDEAA